MNHALVGFGIAGAVGIAAGVGLSAAFDGRIDRTRDRAAAIRARAREQLERDDLTPEQRDGLEAVADRRLPASASETVAGAGAITGVAIGVTAFALTPLAGMALLMSSGVSNAFPVLKNMAIGGAILGAGLVAGAGVHALLD